MKNINQRAVALAHHQILSPQASPHYYVGMDVHLRFTAICILDVNGQIVKEESIAGHSEEVCNYLRRALGCKNFDVTFEASDSYGTWLDRLTPLARRIQVAHPNHLLAIWNTKRKTDRIDAQKLARLLFLDLIPAVHVPSIDVRTWRTLIQHRRRLVQTRTAIKNRLRAILRRNHIKTPRNLWSKKNQRWLSDVMFLNPGDTLQRDMLQDDLLHYDRQIHRAEAELDRLATRSPGVQLLNTIPQIGNRTAEAIVAWLDDVSRFANAKKVGSYFGLVTTEDSSGGKQRQGRITRQGPGVVRGLLVEAVWRMKRTDPVVRGWVERVMHDQKKRQNIAVVAAAHKLARCMFAMLQSGEAWNPAA